MLQLHEDCDFRDSSVPCQPILSLYQIMKLPFKLSFQLVTLEASAAGKQILAVTLWISLSVDLERWWLPSCLISLVAPRKVVEFQFNLFLIVRMGVAAYMPFTCFA